MGDRLIWVFSFTADAVDGFFDAGSSLFSNVLSRKLPRWGNVNEKIKWSDLKVRTMANILALNALCHHDISTLPIGVNSTITRDIGNPTDTLSSALSAIPMVSKAMGFVVKRFLGATLGTAPFGLKKGGQL